MILPAARRILLCAALLIVSRLSVTAASFDQMGRRVAVPPDPQRVVALAPSITEIVFALGQGHRLVGATRYSDYPPQAAALPKVGAYIHPELERIVALAPDLCIAVKDGNPRAVVDRLEALGVPVYAVNPVDLASVREAVIHIGSLLHATPEAEALAASMDRRIAAVRARVEGARRPKVLFQIGVAPIVAVGSRTVIHELIVTAGGANVTAGPIPYPRLSREEVIALAPEIIVITSMARETQASAIKAEWERWPGIPAVREGRILTVDSNVFDRPSPRLVEALERLAELIHPQAGGGDP